MLKLKNYHFYHIINKSINKDRNKLIAYIIYETFTD